MKQKQRDRQETEQCDCDNPVISTKASTSKKIRQHQTCTTIKNEMDTMHYPTTLQHYETGTRWSQQKDTLLTRNTGAEG